MAATLPAAGSAAERIANENFKLSAFTDVDAFSAIPLYLDLFSSDPATRAAAIAGLDSINGLPALIALLNGDITKLFPDAGTDQPGYDALSAIDVFFGNNDGTTGGGVFTGGGIDALANYAALSAIPVFFGTVGTGGVFTGGGIQALSGYDALSAIPVFANVATAAAGGNFVGPNSVASALGDYAALSAVDTFFGDGPIGADGVTPIGGVFTGGGIDALAPGPDGSGGYAALSALPVFFGGQNPNAPFGKGVFTGGGIGALKNYDALSAIPAYLNTPQTLAATNTAPQARIAQDPAPQSTLTTGSNSSSPKPKVFSLPVPQVFTPPAPPQDAPKIEAAATPGDNKGPELNVSRVSEKFTPKGIGDNPLLFGSGTPGVDNGMPGWQKALKSVGLGGGGDTSGGASTG